MFCKNCGKELPEGASFCQYCGIPVDYVVESPTQKPKEDNLNDAVQESSVAVDNSNQIDDIQKQDAALDNNEDKLKAFQETINASLEESNIKKETVKVAKYSKWIGTALLILSLVDFITDPPVLTIVLSIAIIAGAVYGFIHKFKPKALFIISVILAAMCLFYGMRQGTEQGFFTIPSKTEKTAVDEKIAESIDNKEEIEGTENATEETVAEVPLYTVGKSIVICGYQVGIPNYYKEEKIEGLNFKKTYISDNAILAFDAVTNESLTEQQKNDTEKALKELSIQQFDIDSNGRAYTMTEINLPNKYGYEAYYNSNDGTCFKCTILFNRDAGGVLMSKILLGDKSKEQYMQDYDQMIKRMEVVQSPAAEEKRSNTEVNTNGLRSDFKAAMDSYEDFFDEYCSLMKKMKNDPTDMQALSAYADYMSKYEDTMKKMDEWESKDLNDAEMKYYLEVTTRIEKKLLEAAQ